MGVCVLIGTMAEIIFTVIMPIFFVLVDFIVRDLRFLFIIVFL